ncbi:MAG: hypothetical protein LBQ54_03940 [Planctomycetaceae bacterium]|nr:hypothetical protein [Planctomycetaceae bacterium]
MSLLGFLTVTENVRYGFIGGYLVLNISARPVEFHCTAPVRATRAQEILYGTTLRAFLCGEQIAPTLIQRSKNMPMLFLTDYPFVLSAQNQINAPMIYVPQNPRQQEIRLSEFGMDGETAREKVLRESVLDADGNPLNMTVVHGKEFGIAENPPQHSREEILTWIETFSEKMDLLEPFERIRLALEEAQRAA